MKKFDELSLSGKKVLIRADLNVPLDEELKITDSTRIEQFVPTLKAVLERGGLPVVTSHLGRPEGRVVSQLSLKPVAAKLGELLNCNVLLAPDCIGSAVEKLTQSLDHGQVLLLENLRFNPGEESNDANFAAALAKLGEVYVNDAFGTAHRAHASIVTLPKLFRERSPGLLMEKELAYYERALINPKRPLCVVLGGAKVSSKLKTLLNLVEKTDKLLIGGAMANTFLAAQGMQMGRSLYQPELFPIVLQLLGTLARRNCKLYLPVDFRVGTSPKGQALSRVFPAQEVPPDTMALDIGPATSLLFAEAIADAETIIWNGPMGAFENEDFVNGTVEVVQAIASAHGLKVVGGGDTDAAIHKLEMSHKFDFISTGGGAFLALLEGAKLPGVTALD